jgi:nitrite reductase (NAD(P)H)
VGTRIVAVNTTEKHVLTANGNRVPYDKLIFATGSDAVIPSQVPSVEGVFSYRTISDLERMIEFSKNIQSDVKRAVVIGGGLLGLEAAHAIQSLQQFDHVEIVQRSAWLLSRQLDQQAGLMVNQQVEKLGIHLRLESGVQDIVQENGQVQKIVMKDGTTLDCQLICFAIGIRPRDEIAKACGISTHKRGGIIVNPFLETNAPDVYAVGECACFEDNTFGLIAPGIEMANVLCSNLTLSESKEMGRFQTPDLSTKLKLLGVEVASFGDYFADRDGPKSIPGTERDVFGPDDVQALVYRDPFSSTYKKYIFSSDGKYLVGGMMIGDTTDYIKLLSIVKSGKPLDIPASQLILGGIGNDQGLESLPDDTQICSCMNITKKDIVAVIKDGSCISVDQVKKCTKAGTQCGGCVSLVQNLFETTMKSMGAKISKSLCIHFDYARAELMHIVRVRKLKTFEEIMNVCGNISDSIGCEVCKPAIASILSSLWNGF